MAADSLSTRLDAALARARITQAQFAERAGVSQPTISDIRRGGDPRLSTYRKIVAALEQIERDDREAAAP